MQKSKSPALKPGKKVVLSTFTSNLAQRYNPSAAEASHRNFKILLSIFKGFFLQAAFVSLLLENSIYVFSYPCDENFLVCYRILCYLLFNKKICEMNMIILCHSKAVRERSNGMKCQ